MPLRLFSRSEDNTPASFEAARQRMIRDHLMARGIRDARLLEAMSTVPREWFVPADRRHEAYGDYPVPIACGQTISQPFIVAEMTQLLRLSGDEKVLEIGTGSGYQTALLAKLARRVVSIERHGPLSTHAAETLRRLDLSNIRLVVGDGTLGFQEEAPYDRILITAAAPRFPQSLTDQLADGGLAVAPIGDLDCQYLVEIRRQGETVTTNQLAACRFVPLIGQEGWPDR